MFDKVSGSWISLLIGCIIGSVTVGPFGWLVKLSISSDWLDRVSGNRISLLISWIGSVEARYLF